MLPETYTIEVRPVVVRGALTDLDVDAVWRDEWGRLLALLVAQFRRLDLAEDGLGDAFETAADPGRRDGIPDNPAGLAADRGPAPDLRPAARRGDRRPQAAAAGRSTRHSPRRHARSWPTRARRWSTSGSGWCCCAPTRRSRPSTRPRSPCGWCWASRPPTSPGCSWCRTPTMAARLTRARKALAGRAVRGAVRRRARGAGGDRRRRRLPRLHRRLRARLGRRPAPGRPGRARRSGWSGCCVGAARRLRRTAPTSTRCSR